MFAFAKPQKLAVHKKQRKMEEGKNVEEIKEEQSAINNAGSEAAKKKKKKKKKKKTGPNAPALDSTTGSHAEGEISVPPSTLHTDNTIRVDPTGITPEANPVKLKKIESVFKKYTVEPKQHKFWDTQPVPKLSDALEEINEPIEPPSDEVPQTPLKLPEGYEWVELDIQREEELSELYTLLVENYVEDDDNMFRFDYSREFLKWALQPPGWKKFWHVGVRANGRKLVAFISAIPATIRSYNKNIPLVEINFLCVLKKLREKRLAPVLIKEITRRVHVEGRWQAVYTAGKMLPRPVAICSYFHRTLNPKKLVEVEFTHVPHHSTLSMTIKLYKLPDKTVTPGWRKMEKRDIEQVGTLLRSYLSKFTLAPVLEDADIFHWLLPREGVVNSFVVEDPTTKKLTDFVSFYSLPSTVINNPKHKTVFAAYAFYSVSSKTEWEQLMNDALIEAKLRGFDVFNALDIMENDKFLKKLKFAPGDGKLHYYLYNWKTIPMEPQNVGLVML